MTRRPADDESFEDASEELPRIDAPERVFPRHVTDARGRSMSFRLPDRLERELDLTLSNTRERGLPWRTQSDLCRDAVAWFITMLNQKLEFGDPVLDSLQMQHELEDHTKWLNGIKVVAAKSVKELTELLLNHIVAGDVARAREALLSYQRKIARMPDPFLRGQYEVVMAQSERFQEARQSIQEAEDEHA